MNHAQILRYARTGVRSEIIEKASTLASIKPSEFYLVGDTIRDLSVLFIREEKLTQALEDIRDGKDSPE